MFGFGFRPVLKGVSAFIFLCRSCSSQSTIFGLSSGYGKCGVAVIRVSGPKSLLVIKSIARFKDDKIVPRHAYLKKLYQPKSKSLIDKGLCIWFPGPNSFTGEDSCEFQIHGGPAVITALLTCLSSITGCRPAQRGEFTKRAFYAGKLDLTEVEGLADLIHAETEYQRKQALLQANGSLSKLYKSWTDRLLKCTANIEAYIDFSEDQNIESNILSNLELEIIKLEQDISKHLKDGRKGELLRHGVRTVILGAPNVGKSSFMNKICCKPISIVTHIAGTTRDIIETSFNIAGYPVIFADTAGLRTNTKDIVETEGISRAIQYANTADLIILIIDASQLTGKSFQKYYDQYIEELGIEKDLLKRSKMLILINKIDLINNMHLENVNGDYDVCYVSCQDDTGISLAVDKIAEHLKDLCREPSAECPNLSQHRHRDLLTKSLNFLAIFRQMLEEEDEFKGHQDLAIAAHQLRMGLRCIGQITGAVSTEDILDVIFREFCIGK